MEDNFYKDCILFILDQGRYDAIFKMPEMHTSLKELEGIIRKCEVMHLPSLTQPGHATILTGKTLKENGIVADCWLDRRTEQQVYLKGNIKYLIAQTISDIALMNGFEVVSLSGKESVSLLLAGHYHTVQSYVFLFPQNESRSMCDTNYFSEFNKQITSKLINHLRNNSEADGMMC